MNYEQSLNTQSVRKYCQVYSSYSSLSPCLNDEIENNSNLSLIVGRMYSSLVQGGPKKTKHHGNVNKIVSYCPFKLLFAHNLKE